VVPLNGGTGRTVYTIPEGGYVLLSSNWWPDGKGLLFWDDPAGWAHRRHKGSFFRPG
jgi:hypothetical protein